MEEIKRVLKYNATFETWTIFGEIPKSFYGRKITPTQWEAEYRELNDKFPELSGNGMIVPKNNVVNILRGQIFERIEANGYRVEDPNDAILLQLEAMGYSAYRQKISGSYNGRVGGYHSPYEVFFVETV